MSGDNGANSVSRSRELMMRALDDEISAGEWKEFEDLLNSDDSLRHEWQALQSVTENTRSVGLEKPPDELWEGYMDSVYRRVERGIGWILLSIGAIVLISYGLWQKIQEMLGEVTLPWYVKGGALALLAGIVILAVSVVREKYLAFKNDPFRDVER